MFVLTETYKAAAGNSSTGLNIFLGAALVVVVALFVWALLEGSK